MICYFVSLSPGWVSRDVGGELGEGEPMHTWEVTPGKKPQKISQNIHLNCV